MGQIQIEIVKASPADPSELPHWYASVIGQRFPVTSVNEKGYWVRSPDGLLNVVLQQDAKVV